MNNFPIVGIGASAGGLAAFETFFSGLPAGSKPDVAFVLIQHLSPEHNSILSELIRHYTHLPVFEVTNGIQVKPNCVYVIPPNHEMTLDHDTLKLKPYNSPNVHPLLIDIFFQSLAKTQAAQAIGVILSGTGNDGVQGLMAIKQQEGIVFTQDLNNLAFEGMPKNAAATGLVDFVLPAQQIIPQIMELTQNHTTGQNLVAPEDTERLLKPLFDLILSQTGHDFSEYKPSSILRRVERRMAIKNIKSIKLYLHHLKQNPKEVETLYLSLLIGVTRFFRDADAYEALKPLLKTQLFQKKLPQDTLRFWVSACSTGEEVYSIAILIQEILAETKQNLSVQIFATDLDSRAIIQARTGLYPRSITEEVSPQRLQDFFFLDPEGNGYRIQKKIRDMVVFSEHDIIKDPPFSKLDFISCRNLLIYMTESLQQKLLNTLHYALNKDGILFLGSSEAIGNLDYLFDTPDAKAKIFQKKLQTHKHPTPLLSKAAHPMKSNNPSLPSQNPKESTQPKLPLRELTEQTLLKNIAPSAALINEQGDILYVHGRLGKYLELPEGLSGPNNILQMAPETLKHDLTLALLQVTQSQTTSVSKGIQVNTKDHTYLLNLTLQPVTDHPLLLEESALYLVILEEHPAAFLSDMPRQTEQNSAIDSPQIGDLKQALQLQERHLTAVNKKLEASNEELKSYNEEMQSMNEELQSTNEELETSKEELQSVNEELSTVNTELQSKVAELSHANNDMNNLLAGTGIGTVFVDHDLHILRFTPAITKVINLISTDIGRPVNHIASNLKNYDQLHQDIQQVLTSLVPIKVEVESFDHVWYLMQIQPYRTLENVIEGAVISFVNINELVMMREALQKSQALANLASVINDARDAIIVQDLKGNILNWNPAAEALYGWTEAEALHMNIQQITPTELLHESLERTQDLSLAKHLTPYETQRKTKSGDNLEIKIISTALINPAGQIYAISTTERALNKKPPVILSATDIKK
ncbi:chemotaxis protein CheB [Thiosulfativibrio zosterae]|uniref:protein-glutamate O-methyltransferase n=1 Tax=Thiosulfativibrio zosterae TaxID=2675053 RepID=A0A6F8PKV6_9GAMM|nr:chemotaxis protein CheB [Thiosulfativibrio zosterae]BBP42630.1 chemotaxis protein CheR [Thiosulfativibrio zosterae]